MSCHAPLFVNVNPGGMQWKSVLIGYNSITAYGSPLYYAHTMFNTNIGDKIVPFLADNIPTQIQKLPAKDLATNVHPKEIPAIFYVATRSSKTETIYLKFVNTTQNNQKVNIELNSIQKVALIATHIILKANKPDDTNSITEPKKLNTIST